MTAGNPGHSFVPRDGVGFAQTPGAVAVLQAEPGAALVVPHGALLLVADFVRQGSDLLLVGPDGTQILIKGYFALDHPPALITEGGAMLAPDLVARLAGPLAPGQYAQAALGAEAAPIGRVATADGTVTATRVDGTQVTLATDSAVFQGDILETGDGAAVGLVFNDDTTFSLGADARMVLDELVYDPDTGSGRLAFSVLQGVFVFVSGEIAASGPDQMVVRTPVATIGIRGTKVAGQAAAEGERNVITLLPEPDGSVGGISVTNASGTITLSQAFQTTLVTTALLPPSPPVVLPAAAANLLYGGVERTAPRPEAEAPGAREREAAAEEAQAVAAEAGTAAAEAEAAATAAAEAAAAEVDPDAAAELAAEAEALAVEAEALAVEAGAAEAEAEALAAAALAAALPPGEVPPEVAAAIAAGEVPPEVAAGVPAELAGLPAPTEEAMAAAYAAAAEALIDAVFAGAAPDEIMAAAATAAMVETGLLAAGAELTSEAVAAFEAAWAAPLADEFVPPMAAMVTAYADVVGAIAPEGVFLPEGAFIGPEGVFITPEGVIVGPYGAPDEFSFEGPGFSFGDPFLTAFIADPVGFNPLEIIQIGEFQFFDPLFDPFF